MRLVNPPKKKKPPEPSTKRNRSPELRAILEPIVLHGKLDTLSQLDILEVPRFAADLRRNGNVSTRAQVHIVNNQLDFYEHMALPFTKRTDNEKRDRMAMQLFGRRGEMLTPLERAKFNTHPPERYPELLAQAEAAYDSDDELRLFESGRWRKRGSLGERAIWQRRLKQLRADLGPKYLDARSRNDKATCSDVLRQKIRSIREHPSAEPRDFFLHDQENE